MLMIVTALFDLRLGCSSQLKRPGLEVRWVNKGSFYVLPDVSLPAAKSAPPGFR